MTAARNLGIVLTGGLAALMLVAGCGSDAGSSDAPGPGGASSMAVAGDVEGTFGGYATYTDASLELGQFAVAMTDNRSFALDLSIVAEDNAPPPAGRYTIGSGYGSDTVRVTFNQFKGGSFMNRNQYSPTGDAAGFLEITSSTDTGVVANFEFTARDDAGKQIAVTNGTFEARQVAGRVQQ